MAARICSKTLSSFRIGFLFILLCSAPSYQDDSCTDTFGLNGKCMSEKDCVYASRLSKGINPSPCKLTPEDDMICCTKQEEWTSAFILPRGPMETARYWCEKYKEQCPKLFEGTNDLPTEFPHMAAIGFGELSTVEWKCGGSLISQKFVLTAARCLGSPLLGRAQWVLLGTEINRFQTEVENNGQIHPVIQRIPHPRYSPPSKYDDLGLIEIGPSISPNAISTIGKFLHPACLPTKDWGFGSFNAVSTEWSYVEFGDITNTEVFVGELGLMNPPPCNVAFEQEVRETIGLHRGIDYTMLCGKMRRGKRQECNADTAGSLQFAVWSACMYQIWGVNSFWKNCSLADPSAVYIRIFEYVPWIQSYVWPPGL